MNDKNFIETLRQKREEYGVTQTRLAVACGISREYYNRIEKGKLPLTEELKEILEKQIERFNPKKPLFLLVDYFRVRFPTTDALAIIRDVLQLKADYMLYEDYGKYGYESKYVLGDINIMCSMQEHLGVLLELKGKGCRQMECYLWAQERSWYDFMLDCMTAGGVMKRLDLAINDRAGILDIPKLKAKYKAGECVSYFRMQKDYSGTEKCGSDTPKNTGETIYLGSTSSELYMCAYQKNYEQYVKNGIEVEDTEIKNRFEIRMKNERAYYAVVDLLTYRDAERTAFSIINHYVHFLTVYCITSIISDNAYFFNTRGIFSRFSNHNLLLRLMVFPDSRFSKSVPFKSSAQIIFVLISDIPLISCKMWLHSFCILPRLPIEEVFSFPIHGQAPQSSLEARFLVCRILFLLPLPLQCPVPVFF